MAPRIVILDRDGVINEDSPDYIRSPADWHPIPGSIEAIADLSKAGYSILVATNQSGVGRGLFSLDTLERMHEKLRQLVLNCGGQVDGIYYCPHRPDENCGCRKPLPGLLNAIAADFSCQLQGVNLVGDSMRDLEAGAEVGCELSLVLTGKGTEARAKLGKSEFHWARSVNIHRNLASFARYLLYGYRD